MKKGHAALMSAFEFWARQISRSFVGQGQVSNMCSMKVSTMCRSGNRPGGRITTRKLPGATIACPMQRHLRGVVL